MGEIFSINDLKNKKPFSRTDNGPEKRTDGLSAGTAPGHGSGQ